jgi:hypothetical protein
MRHRKRIWSGFKDITCQTFVYFYNVMRLKVTFVRGQRVREQDFDFSDSYHSFLYILGRHVLVP